MSERKYYCFCSSNCKYETMTKEQILAAITQAVESGEIRDVDAGFITKVKETNAGGYVTFWVGTRAEYNALDKTEKNCLYIFTDDTSMDDFNKTVKSLLSSFDELSKGVHAETASAKAVAAEAKSEAAAAVGMVREFDTGYINEATYTTAGIKSKFYIVTLNDDGMLTNITVDYMGIKACAVDTGAEVGYGYTVYIATEGTFLGRQLTAKLNGDGTVTFTAPTSAKIVHICGYY